MNWTEGALARHSRGKGWKPELAKQKQYFAKARGGLQKASKPSLASVSFLSRQPDLPTGYPGKRPPKILTLSSPHFQRRQSQHDGTRGHHFGRSTRQRPREEDPSTGDREFPKPHLSPHIYSKRKHTVDEKEDLNAKRRRLLQKSDWAGINVQKAMPLHFPASGNLAGNRIWGFRNSHATGQPAPFFRRISHNEITLRGRATSHSSTQDGDRGIRIRIGSEDVQLGTGSQNTTKSPHKRSLRTISKSNNLGQSVHFQETPFQRLPQHHAFSGHRDDKELVGQRTKTSRDTRLGRDGAARRNVARPVLSSTSHGERPRLERLQRVGQPFSIESPPSVVYHPVPQRISQLILNEELGTPKSDTFESTSAQVSHNPLLAIPPSEMSENKRWHDMFASFGERAETPSHLDYNRITTAEDISPGASNFSGLSSPSTHHSSFVQTDLRRNRSGFSDENDHGKKLSGVAISTLRFSSPLAPANMFVSSGKSNANDLDNDIAPSQGKTHTAEEIPTWNMFNTVIQHPLPLPSIASDSPGEQTLDQHDRDVFTGGSGKEPKNQSFVSQPSEIGTVQSTSVPGPREICGDTDWINFIFGDGGDEVQDAAFQEARQEAARDLQPSSSSPNGYYKNLGPHCLDHDTSAMAICGRLDHENEKDIISSSSSGSLRFGIGHSDVDALENSALLETHNSVNSRIAIAESTIVEAPESIIQGTDSDHLITDMILTPAMDSASIVAQPPESEVGEVPSQSFQFARPKSFIGRLASSLVQDAGPIVHLSVHNETKKSGRPRGRSRRNKAKDGRADIRGLPDYDGDPIDGGSDE
ncbi:hypothetical protein CT0861_03229 [Colletotrichum tofieldiae]|uniref:Uncharacterized protein n=1 Tax=Colletotrichum tofieldiae TaxID=708197 RepID=A0A166LH12_9PEZI|nr:hypothetical protein CT0861_03229 [Colletotrichum tofieldiae]